MDAPQMRAGGLCSSRCAPRNPLLPSPPSVPIHRQSTDGASKNQEDKKPIRKEGSSRRHEGKKEHRSFEEERTQEDMKQLKHDY